MQNITIFHWKIWNCLRLYENFKPKFLNTNVKESHPGVTKMPLNEKYLYSTNDKELRGAPLKEVLSGAFLV